MSTKIDSAESATKKVQHHAFHAAQVLREGVDGRIMVNLYGIFTDPSKRGSDLRIAREEIDKALAIIEATRWPKDADYDEAERAAGSEDGEE